MYYPSLNIYAQSRQMIDTFGGYNQREKVGMGEFNDMMNMTGDYYPLLSVRKKRGCVAGEFTDLEGYIFKNSPAWVDNGTFYYNGVEIEGFPHLEENEKQLISMGAKIVIFPDGVYFNTEKQTEYGYLDCCNEIEGSIEYKLCKGDGTLYNSPTVSDTPPENPANGELWIDISGDVHILKQWAKGTSMWAQLVSTYVRIEALGIGNGLKEGDGVTVTGCVTPGTEGLNTHTVIKGRGDNFIIVAGIIDSALNQMGGITVKRKAPKMEYVVEAGNRLWGCHYGIDEESGESVNEIYACKLGDPTNWRCYAGISTDSWAGSLGTDGIFTGAINYGGFPIFFKENHAHKVYISSSGAHQIQSVDLRGVQKGSSKSLAVVNEVLYYKSVGGICAYGGGNPELISENLGDKRYINAIAGALGDKYTVSMEDEEGIKHLFVYNTRLGLWHKEDNISIKFFIPKGDELYFAGEDNKIYTTLCSEGEEENTFNWYAQSGEMGYFSPDHKYVGRINIRCEGEIGSNIRISIRYDGRGKWQYKGTIRGTGTDSHTLSVRPKRCDHFAIKIEGSGIWKIYSLAFIMEEGSDIR